MSNKRVVATYPYHAPNGKLIFEKLRYVPKGFVYRLPDGQVTTDCPRKLLYRLGELMAAPAAATIFIVEGEKDVDRLRREGIVATCNGDGGGRYLGLHSKWPPAFNRYFRGREVVIIEDRDWAGRQHGEDIEREIRRAAKSVRRFALPVQHKGDVSDFLDAGGSLEQVLACAAEAAPKGPSLDLAKTGLTTAIKRAISAQLSPTAKLTLLVIACLAEPSQQNIALAVGISLPRVKAVLAELRKDGLIIAARTGRTAIYRTTG